MMDFVNFRIFGNLRVDDFSGENTHRIHGTGMHLPTFIVDFDGKLVGKYIPYMDPMGIFKLQECMLSLLHGIFFPGSSRLQPPR